MRKEKKVIYYSDELKDEFAGVSRSGYEVPKKYKYVHKNIFWRALAFFVYRVIMTPIAFLYCKIKLKLKIVDRTKKKRKDEGGCFLYANHTLLIGDAFIPSLLMFPKKTYVVVNSENLSTFGTRNFLSMSGALPIPKSPYAFRRFTDAIEKRILQGSCVTIYPEAHIWPYYTGIRPFESKSFHFPVKHNVPIYVSTSTFQVRKEGKPPKVTVYIDGPFYPDSALSPHDAEKKLRDTAYETMLKNSENSDYRFIEYIKKEEEK